MLCLVLHLIAVEDIVDLVTVMTNSIHLSVTSSISRILTVYQCKSAGGMKIAMS